MILWRISNYSDLNGLGGIHAEGRWHDAGHRVVYLADHPASCMLEMIVHLDMDFFPSTFQLLKVEIPEVVAVMETDVGSFPDDWKGNKDFTQSLGTKWLTEAPSALLRVPSALIDAGNNYLLNPLHPDAQHCKVLEAKPHPLDARLIKPLRT
ncbi:RES family NAD+ phosphorylase [Iodobacter sp. CM08]|uniref:RES family NAD+ phosphorylase n=1 Tax=Iodobacter sp. CM08 TaxID=3085902 RepID=UPI0029816A8A|nr:RES family NAD+ phosphorylase [Iodobacter sp. CM08]MDW5418740.1 RES family NAD+ phosphorylase [Iodobacter sp. CM08]